MTIFSWKRAAAAAAVCVVLGTGNQVPVIASDHADPMMLTDPDANITDLFFFPDGDRYIVILDVHRALTAVPPYQLSSYAYQINFDWHTGVSSSDGDADTVRYGGKIAHPGGIKADASIRIRLDNDATRTQPVEYSGLLHTDQVQVYTGIRDDPFVFPRFFKKNTIAMVLSLPKSAFPPDRQTFLLWAASFKGDKQVDHVGRSNRTQQARFEGLNTLHPSLHVDAIMKHMAFWDTWVTRLGRYRQTKPAADFLQLLVQSRKYDLVPDVMIYSEAREQNPATRGFPNGRHLDDDVAAQTCAAGDCILQELSFIEGGWPRQAKNDKEFMKTFPYLADPWKDGEFKVTPPLPPSIVPLAVLIGTILLIPILVVCWLAVQGIKYRRLLRRQRETV